MWICSECETKNNDSDRFCACCGAARPAAAAPAAPKTGAASANTPRASQQRSSQTPPPAQGERRPPVQGAAAEPRRAATSTASHTVTDGEKRLSELNRQVTIPTVIPTMQDNGVGFWIRKFFVSVFVALFGGAILTYAPLLILEDLWTMLFSHPLVTVDQISVLGGPFILLSFILYWVYIFKSKSKANTFAAEWNGKELIFAVPPAKDSTKLAIAVDGTWIAFGSCVPGGDWIRRDGAVVGLHCARSWRPRAAVLAEINTDMHNDSNGVHAVYRPAYIAVAEVR